MIEPLWQKAVTSGDDSQLPVAAINTRGFGCDAGGLHPLALPLVPIQEAPYAAR
jgi:hypothetical protein